MTITEARVKRIEDDLQHHAKSIGEIISASSKRDIEDDAGKELEALKESHTNERIARLELRVEGIYSAAKWFATSVAGLILAAVVTFILSGKVAIGQEVPVRYLGHQVRGAAWAYYSGPDAGGGGRPEDRRSPGPGHGKINHPYSDPGFFPELYPHNRRL